MNHADISQVNRAGKGVTLVRLLLAVSLIVGGLGIYVWNEQEALKRYQDYQNRVGKYTKIDAKTIDPANEGKPVYFTTKIDLSSRQWLRDPQLGVKVKNAVALRRKALTYQWVETKDKQGKFAYSTTWSSKYHDSKKFAVLDASRENPPQVFTNKLYYSNQLRVGAFRITDIAAAMRRLDSVFVDYPFLTKEYINEFPAGWRPRITMLDDRLRINMGKSKKAEPGDADIYYSVLPEGTVVTVVGRQTGTFISPLEEIVPGERKIEEIRGNPKRGMELDVWHYREGSAFLVFIGFSLLLFSLGARKAGASAVRHGSYQLGALSGSVMVCGLISGFYWKTVPGLAYQVNIAAGVAAAFFLLYLILAFYGIPGKRSGAARPASVKVPRPAPAVSPAPAAEPQIVVPPSEIIPPTPGSEENKG